MVSVTLDNVTKRFDNVRAVDRVSLEIGKGEFFFLLGPSGCGKTTLLRVIAGFYQPEGGRVLFDGRDITDVPPNKRNTGMVFQNYALWPHMSVRQNVEYGLRMRDVPLEERTRRAEHALDRVQMAEYGSRTSNQLSGGQQQRVALARALVIEPDAILLDEPLSNLDARLRLEMREQIQELHRELGITMIYVTHDQKEALSMADRMAVMQTGRIAQIGAPRDLYTHPHTRFVADFIGEINLLPGEIVSTDPVQVDTAAGPIRSSQVLDTSALDALKKGDTALCAIRPEALIFVPEAKDTGGHNVITGRVEHVIYLGDMEQYHVALSDGTHVKLVEHNPLARKAREGDDVRLSFAPESVVILPKETAAC
jgi:iron(III) transport system ATP-binding protein